MDPEQTIARAFEARAAVRARADAENVHALARAADDLGYLTPETVQRAGTTHDEFLAEACEYLRRHLEVLPSDHGAQQSGVLLANDGQYREARRCFRAALKLAGGDANIHENLRILDILTGRPSARWHDIPEGARKDERTLVAYVDPHAM